MTENIHSLSQTINKAFDNIHIEEMKKANTIFDTWRSILLKIRSNTNPNEGRKLADHSRILDLKNGILTVEVDHPGWMELLQLHKKFILKGFSFAKPKVEVYNIVFRISGTQEPFSKEVSNEKNHGAEKKDMFNLGDLNTSSDLDEGEESQNVPKNEGVSSENAKLPPALSSIFDDLYKNMLTNPKK